MGGLKNVVQAYKESRDSVEKIIYTSSFFALGSTDGYVADETQVKFNVEFFFFNVNLFQFNVRCACARMYKVW